MVSFLLLILFFVLFSMLFRLDAESCTGCRWLGDAGSCIEVVLFL